MILSSSDDRQPPALSSRLVSISAAREACDQWHSHHEPPLGGLFAIGVFLEQRLICVAIVGRPVARELQKLETVVEVTRLASDRSTRGAASFALRACVAEALRRGYRRIVSYTILGESGACYRAARWRPVIVTKGNRQWTCKSRPRKPSTQPGRKVRWETGPDALPRCMDAWNAVAENAGKIQLNTRSPKQQALPL